MSMFGFSNSTIGAKTNWLCGFGLNHSSKLQKGKTQTNSSNPLPKTNAETPLKIDLLGPKRKPDRFPASILQGQTCCSFFGGVAV